MELSVNCPNCNRRIAYPPASAGAVWLCPDCQSRVQLPEEAAAPLPGEEEVPGTEIMLADTPAELAAIVEPAGVTASSPGEAAGGTPGDEPEWVEPVGNPLMPWLIVSGALVFLLAMTLLYISLRKPPAWDALHRQDILDLKAEAERLGGLGKYRDAYDKFQELDRLVEGNPVTDPALKGAIQEAQDEEQQMLTQVLEAGAREARIKARLAGQIASTGPAPTTAPGVAGGTDAPPQQPKRPAARIVTSPAALGTNGRPLVDDDRIGRSIRGGVQFLLNHFQDNRLHNTTDYSDGGVDALAVYALLQAYQATGDSRLDPRRNFMSQALDELKSMSMNDHQGTYGRALRMMALQVAGRKGDLPAIEADLQGLLRTGRDGANSYYDWEPPANDAGLRIMFNWDNSNSQYGLLGAWAAAEAGVNVPRGYWVAAQHHWVSSQMNYGTWAYYASDTAGTPSMTLAGLASLIVSQDFLHDDAPEAEPSAKTLVADRADRAVTSAIEKAMNWLESGDHAAISFRDQQNFPGYSLYGLERVGLASGYKYFGAHDWYRESAADVVSEAGADGGWTNDIDTSFALLILSRGRHPIMLNKLRFAGDWNARPRDAANLADYASKTLERQVNWQVVPLNHLVADWSDSPLLYLSSHDPPPMSADDEGKIREFVLNGGLVMTAANTEGKAADPKNGDETGFDQWVTDLGTRLFAPYQWTDLPADHPLWNVLVRLKKRPALKVIGNGSRIFMVQLPDDIARVWQSRAQVDRADDFALGLDLFLYAAGKSELRNRLQTDVIPSIAMDPRASTAITQLQVGDDSDPEPMAWPRFARWFRLQTDLGVLLYERPLEDLKPTDSPIAHLTGVNGFKPTEAQCQALREYVQSGGIVLIDPCGGPNAFLASVKNDLLPRAFPSVNLTRVPDDHPLLTNSADGMSQLEPADLRDYVRALDPPIDRGIWMLRSGKGAVIVSSLDITTGLLGANHWGIAGFTPRYSLSLAKNLVLWAWDGGKDQ